LIPFNALLSLGTEAQARFVASAGALGHTLLAIEHSYGSAPMEDHDEARACLDRWGSSFKVYLTESSVAFIGAFALNTFLQQKRPFAQKEDFPLFLTDLLLGRSRRARPANQATSLMAVTAHLAGLNGISFLLRRSDRGEMSLYDPKDAIIVDFPSGRAEMQAGTTGDSGEPLTALIAFHLAGLADAISETEQAARMYRAARMIYSE
jgi:hypothetical protein